MYPTGVDPADSENMLAAIGVSLNVQEDSTAVGIGQPSSMPHLVNLNEDPLMSECLLYYIKEGTCRVGRRSSEVKQDIQLSGLNIQDEHCILENNGGMIITIAAMALFSRIAQGYGRFVYVCVRACVCVCVHMAVFGFMII